MKRRYILQALLPLLLLSVFVQAELFSGKVTGVADGDTIEVMRDGMPLKIRLDGIDCPESGQDFGNRAKQLTSGLCFGEEVKVNVKELDRYGRSVASVILPDGTVLNEELVRKGLAWWYEQYSPNNGILKELQEQARSERIGLWSVSNPISPWEFRHGENSASVTFASSFAQSHNVTQPADSTLYVTMTGSKVHVDGCRYLSKSQIPITAEQAAKQGYTACSVCNPDLSDTSYPSIPRTYISQSNEEIPSASNASTYDYTVYVTRTGKKYHAGGCRYLSKSQIPMSLSQAQGSGYGPCSVCNP
ncbi:MAG: thermonuclease family protein [Candidatus Hydrogenedentes bacterium]|mgnify:CR=1 FL=1|nr:thermonuclease family protein [Candidatus Hydrogenedentota bacterium]